MLDDYRAAEIEPALKAMLRFLEKLTLSPESVTPTDVDVLRAAGLTDDQIENAIHICAAFNIIDRIADTLNFHVPSDKAFAATGKVLLKRGYLL